MPLDGRPPPSRLERSPALSSSSSASSSSVHTDPSTPRSLETSPSIPFQHLTIQDKHSRPVRPGKLPARAISYHDAGHAPSHPSVSADSRSQEPSVGDAQRMLNQKPRVEGEGAQNASSSPYRSSADRPLLAHRTSSFSKRHASFDTPREVPLPYMPARQHPTFANPSSHLRSASLPQDPDVHAQAPSKPVDRLDPPFPPFERQPSDDSSYSSTPDSLPSASSFVNPARPIDTPMDVASTSSYFMDMSGPSEASTSTASPYQTQRNGAKPAASPVHPFARPFSSPDAMMSVPPRIHSPTPMRPPSVPDRSSTASLPLPSDTPYRTLPRQDPENDAPVSTASPPPLSRASVPPLRPPSPPRVARPWSPMTDLSWMHNRNASPPLPSHMSVRSYSSVSSASPEAEHSLPPPAPPMVLTPPPASENEEDGPRAPHDSFLAHSPPPNDSYITVETSSREYRLLVRLPGFRRDAITLSTRKRRILHVVADSWEPGGGHFERRISFGYDADLGQVRAEFDGEFLRVIVPRRATPVTYWGRV